VSEGAFLGRFHLGGDELVRRHIEVDGPLERCRVLDVESRSRLARPADAGSDRALPNLGGDPDQVAVLPEAERFLTQDLPSAKR